MIRLRKFQVGDRVSFYQRGKLQGIWVEGTVVAYGGWRRWLIEYPHLGGPHITRGLIPQRFLIRMENQP